MTKPNPWKAPELTGPAFGGPLAGSDITHDQERKEIFVCEHQVGFYLFDDGSWFWQPNDAS